MIARTPETERAARHMLRTRLRWTGFGNIMPGVWLSPRSDRGDEVRQILDEAGLPEGYLFTAEYQGGSPLAAMVGHAWDLDELARAYDEFIAAFSGPSARSGRPGHRPSARLAPVPVDRPGLPAQFLPAPWSGTAAARLFARRHAQWAGRCDRRMEAVVGQNVTLASTRTCPRPGSRLRQAGPERGHPLHRRGEGGRVQLRRPGRWPEP